MYCSCLPIYRVLPDLEFQLVFCSHDLSLSVKELIEGVSWVKVYIHIRIIICYISC